MMKKIFYIGLLAAGLTTFSGCEKYLEVNTNPNYPQEVAPYLYLAPIESYMALGVQFDARYIGKYVQNWAANFAGDTWDRHGYIPGSDASGELFRNVYWKLGLNLGEMIRLSEQQERYDLAGAGKIIRAWGWQMLTDYSGEIILSEAFVPDKKVFNYDTQEQVYAEVVRLCLEGIKDLERTDGAVSQAYMARGDMMFNGDRAKWIKFAYGILAINAHHLSNKPNYNPDAVIGYVDKSMASNADDAYIPFNGTVPGDANFFGPLRGNITSFRQTNYIVSLMDGSKTGGVVDPRIGRMLVAAPDGVIRGIEPVRGYGALAVSQRPNTLWNTLGSAPAGFVGRYLFDNKAKFPLMTYAQMQFIKAEAAVIKNDQGTGRQAYLNGVSAHIDFVNQVNSQVGAPGFTPISSTEKATYLASAAIPAGALTVSDVLFQKYIAQFGWAFIETWSDIRRYHYDTTILNGFTPPSPTELFPDNNGQLAYRFRLRYNSEYVWNRSSLEAIGALNPDFHTQEMWFTKP